MFSFIVKPLFLWLRWTHDHWVANWGWDIVILTIIINIALAALAFEQHEVGVEDSPHSAANAVHSR